MNVFKPIKDFIEEVNPLYKALILTGLVYVTFDWLSNQFISIYENEISIEHILEWSHLLSMTLAILAGIIYFVVFTRLPRSSSKVGILFYIDTDDDENTLKLEKKIQKRIIDNFGKSILNSFKLSFVDTNRHRINTLNDSDIPKLMKKSKSTLFFVIRLHEGRIDNRTCIEVESNYMIHHRTLSGESRRNLSILLGRTLMKAMNVYMDNDLEDTKKFSMACVMSSFIGVGLVFAINNNLITAKEYLDEAMRFSETHTELDEIFRGNMKMIVIPMYFEIMTSFELDFFERRYKNRTDFKVKLEEFRVLLDKLESKFGKSKEIDYKRVASHFLLYRDPSYTRKLIKIDKAYKRLSIVQRLDKAFIYLYEGKIEEGFYIYRRVIQKGNITKVNMSYVHNYIDYVLWDEPDKYQLYIPLILINHFCRDSKVAKTLFEELKEKHEDIRSYDEIDKVIPMIEEIISKEEMIYFVRRTS